MTKNINNNEIETLEGNYTESMRENYTQEEQNYNEPSKPKRNFTKPLIIGGLAVLITAGVGAYAYDRYETNQRSKLQEAYSNVKVNVGKNKDNNQDTNLDTGVNSGNNSTSTETNISSNSASSNNSSTENTQQNQNVKSHEEIRRIVAGAISVPESNIQFLKMVPEYEDDYSAQNNGQPLYIYEVEARANSLEYDIHVDAVTGKVLKIRIDNQ